jgi:hypothetical protein
VSSKFIAFNQLVNIGMSVYRPSGKIEVLATRIVILAPQWVDTNGHSGYDYTRILLDSGQEIVVDMPIAGVRHLIEKTLDQAKEQV